MCVTDTQLKTVVQKFEQDATEDGWKILLGVRPEVRERTEITDVATIEGASAGSTGMRKDLDRRLKTAQCPDCGAAGMRRAGAHIICEECSRNWAPLVCYAHGKGRWWACAVAVERNSAHK